MWLIPIFQWSRYSQLCRYNTPNSTYINLNSILHSLEKESNYFTQVIYWKSFEDWPGKATSSYILNTGNCGGMANSKSKCEKLMFWVSTLMAFESNADKLICNKLTFESHVRSPFKKARQNLNGFARTACSLKSYLRKLLLNAFWHLNFFMLQLFGCFTTKNK